MFIGEFEYRVDDKGRVPIPPKFRLELKEEGVVLKQGVEKCITIYTLSLWRKLAEQLPSGPIITGKMRRLNRAFFASAFNVELDGQGRISIPNQLRQECEIKDEVVVAGVNTYIELWSKDLWGEEKVASQEEQRQTIESLSEQR